MRFWFVFGILLVSLSIILFVFPHTPPLYIYIPDCFWKNLLVAYMSPVLPHSSGLISYRNIESYKFSSFVKSTRHRRNIMPFFSYIQPTCWPWIVIGWSLTTTCQVELWLKVKLTRKWLICLVNKHQTARHKSSSRRVLDAYILPNCFNSAYIFSYGSFHSRSYHCQITIILVRIFQSSDNIMYCKFRLSITTPRYTSSYSRGKYISLK